MQLLTASEVAERLNVSTSTLAHWRLTGRGPAYVRTSRGDRAPVRYIESDLEKYINDLRVDGDRENTQAV